MLADILDNEYLGANKKKITSRPWSTKTKRVNKFSSLKKKAPWKE